jgi:hypothetical protein
VSAITRATSASTKTPSRAISVAQQIWESTLTASSCGREGSRNSMFGRASVVARRASIGFVIAMGALAAQAGAPLTMNLKMQPPKGYFIEQCFTLESGQQLAYRLSTPHPIEFNLHHHPAEGGTAFPDRLVVSSQHSKRIVAESAGAYCFMATNAKDQPGAFDVVINYEITAG